MGQGELVEALEKLDRPISRGELAKIMGLDPVLISHHLATLIKHNEVQTKEISRKEAKDYNCRRAIRLYYIKREEVKTNGRTRTTTKRTEIKNY